MTHNCEGAIRIVREVGSALNRLARPYLTALVATLFNCICGWTVLTGKLSIRDYIMAVGPTNAMIIGFWFGEKAALSVPEHRPAPPNSTSETMTRTETKATTGLSPTPEEERP